MRILILKEKHGDRYWAADTPAQLGESACEIIKGRLANGYYYEEPYATEARGILDLADERARHAQAWNFLRRRSGYEYEGVDTETLEGTNPVVAERERLVGVLTSMDVAVYPWDGQITGRMMGEEQVRALLEPKYEPCPKCGRPNTDDWMHRCPMKAKTDKGGRP